jgi:hypothetical protein
MIEVSCARLDHQEIEVYCVVNKTGVFCIACRVYLRDVVLIG